MLKEIVVTNPSGERLPLTLMRPESSGLILVDVQGLGPAKANVNVRENATISGSIFNSVKTPSRNIVLTLSFLESPTIEAARLRTYRYFPTESQIRLDVRTDAGTFYIYGYVESNEPTIFSIRQGCVVSVVCPNPFFKAHDGYRADVISPIGKLFEFPFSNPVGVEGIIFGERIFDSPEFTIPFDGTIPVGPTFRIQASGGEVNNPSIFFYNPNVPGDVDVLSFNFTDDLPPLNDGDYLLIVCERQNKSVTRYVASTGQLLNYIGAVTLDSSWPLIRQGDNEFSYTAEDGGEYIRFSYEYSLQYSGV